MVTAQHVSGRQVLGAIESAVNQSRSQARELQQGLKQLDANMRRLVDQRSESLFNLAQHYLPEMSQHHVDKTFTGIRSELNNVLARKKRRGQELMDEWDRSLDQRQQLEDKIDTITERLNELVAQRELLEAEVAEILKQDDDFQFLSHDIFSAEEELQRNEQRTEEAKRDALEKLPAYRQSRLFQYLYDRNFGTSAYKNTGWTKRWDRWIANMIDFAKARQSYDFLRITPELMAAELERRRQSLAVLLERAEQFERRIADERGLTEVLREGDALGADRDEAISVLEKLSQNAEGIKNEMVALEGNQNKFYEEAITKFGQFLHKVEQSALESHARSTPDRQDDQLMEEIDYFNKQLDQSKQHSKELHRSFRDWEPKIRGLEQVTRRFRTAEFDSRRSLFSDKLHIEHLLQRFLHGSISEQELWFSINHHQEFAPAWHEETGTGGGIHIDPDFSYVMLRALADVATQAMRTAAYRGMQNRGPSLPRWNPPQHKSTQKHRSRRSRRRGGFTSGRGF